MKRYWLFAFNRCQPLGGMGDFFGSFETSLLAKKAIKGLNYDYYEIFDNYDELMVFNSNEEDLEEINNDLHIRF